MQGCFITLEGGDGSGKTTQMERIVAWLEREGIDVVATREPGGTEIGQEIREIVLHSRADISPKAEALLYAADRAQHINAVVRPALAQGKVVLQDRYLDSSVAYQGAGRILDSEEVRNLSLWATDNLLPHLTILLDLPPQYMEQRLTHSRDRYDRLEAEELDFHIRVRDQYLQLAQAEPDRFAIVNAAKDEDAVFEDIFTILRKVIAEHYA